MTDDLDLRALERLAEETESLPPYSLNRDDTYTGFVCWLDSPAKRDGSWNHFAAAFADEGDAEYAVAAMNAVPTLVATLRREYAAHLTTLGEVQAAGEEVAALKHVAALAAAYRAAEVERERAGIASMVAASETDFERECNALDAAEAEMHRTRDALDAALRKLTEGP